jgi:8-oxo-dGTP diphosphatase
MIIGAKAVVIFENKILTILRDNKPNIHYPNMWDIPGGGIEIGETVKDCILREVWEEIGIKPKNVKFLWFEKYDETTESARFIIELTHEEVSQVKLGNEGQELKFMTIAEIEKVNFISHLRDFVLKVILERES